MTWRIEHHVVSPTNGSGPARSVTVALPDDFKASPPLAIYCADGQVVETFAAVLPAASLTDWQPALIGVHSDSVARAQEYLLSDTPQFLSHERFFCDDVRTWAANAYGLSPARQHSAIFGFSNGGNFALVTALRRPAQFAAVIAFSIPPFGQPLPSPPAEALLPMVYLAAGNNGPERAIGKRVRKLVRQLRRENISVESHERAAGHEMEFWRREFVSAVEWLQQIHLRSKR